MSTILIIDDEKIIRERLQNLLELDDYKTFIAEDGYKGLEIFHAKNPDIVLLDLKMPGIQGIDVLQEIKESEKNTEVIIITGHGGVETAIQALKGGAFSYVQKPVDYDELEIEIQKANDKIRMELKIEEYVKNLEKANEEKGKELSLRKIAEKKLTDAVQEWETTFNSIQDLVSIQDNNCRIIKVNKSYAEYFGKKPIELIGSYCFSLLHDQHKPIKDCVCFQVQQIKKTCSIEYYYPKKDSHLEITASPIFDTGNIVAGIVHTMKDITDRKKIEVEKQKYTEHIELDLNEKKKNIAKAQLLQKKLNTSNLPLLKNINLLSYYMPCEELGGDFFNIEVFDDKLLIIFADCTGHGIEVAMDATLIKAISDKHINYLTQLNSPDKYLEKMNNDFINYTHEEQFPTMFAAVIDLETNIMHYANANSEIPFKISKNGISKIEAVEGFHLGYAKNTVYKKKSLKLNDKDIIFFYSDAIKEMKINENEIFNNDRIENIIKKFGNGLQNDLDYLIKQIKSNHISFPLEDDLTLIMVEYRKPYKKQYEITTIEEWNKIEEKIKKILLDFNYSFDLINSTLIAFYEITLNAIGHGNHNSKTEKVKIDLIINCQEINITISDNGKGFDPKKVADPTNYNRLVNLLKEDKEKIYTHGRGIWIVRQYVDELKYNEKGNIASLKKLKDNKFTIFDNDDLHKRVQAHISQPLVFIEGNYIEWHENINPVDIINTKLKSIKILLNETQYIHSVEIGKLLLLINHCEKNKINLILKIKNQFTRELLEKLNFNRFKILNIIQ